MICHCLRKYYSVEIFVDGILRKFSYARDCIKVSTYMPFTLFESYEDSWGTMVTLRTQRDSAVKETSLLISSHILSRRTSPQGSTKYLKGMGTREREVL